MTGKDSPLVPDTQNELVKARFDKLARLRARGIDPYPHRYERSHTAAEAVLLFEAEEKRATEDARTDVVSLAGRIV
ncbi:MAG: hypothetical protein QGF81_07100, partial [Dehalococcoidia bacterium]|nr:hypothetical protein [Dehalococcoidia bacterium]